jgi:ketosteroid isomerase-like protein
MNIDAVRQIIAEENRRFGTAAAGKDYAGMAGFYTEDAKLLPPDAPIVSGRKAIEEFWRTAANALGLIGVELKTIDLEVTGDTAYEIGRGRNSAPGRQRQSTLLFGSVAMAIGACIATSGITCRRARDSQSIGGTDGTPCLLLADCVEKFKNRRAPKTAQM